MKKFFKTIFGLAIVAGIAAGGYACYKKYVKKDEEDFDDFDDFEDDLEEEDDDENREYVSINVAADEAEEPATEE